MTHEVRRIRASAAVFYPVGRSLNLKEEKNGKNEESQRVEGSGDEKQEKGTEEQKNGSSGRSRSVKSGNELKLSLRYGFKADSFV